MQTLASLSARTIETIKLGLSIFGFLVGLISIILVYLQMRKTHEWNRRKASHDTLSEFVTIHMAETRRILVVDFGMDTTASQTYADIESKLTDEERRKFRYHTMQLLNYMEVLCVGMKNNVLDEDICYDYAETLITRVWIWAEPLVKATRQAIGDETLWIEVDNYSNRWLKRLRREREQHLERLRVPGKRPT